VKTNESMLKNKNLYKTVVMMSLRAREISLGSKPMVDIKSTNPALIALQEVRGGKVQYKERKHG